MLEVASYIWEHRNDPWWWVVLGSFLVFIDRMGRKLITDQLKRLFGVTNRDDFKEIIRSQQRIEEKVDLIMKGVGVNWNNVESAASSDSMTRKSSQSCSSTRFPVHRVRLFIRSAMTVLSTSSRGVKLLSKAWIVGLLGYVAYFVKQATGVNIPDEMINTLAEIILLLIPLIAMFGNMRRGEKPNAEHQLDDGPAV